jgi:hypothetical protein
MRYLFRVCRSEQYAHCRSIGEADERTPLRADRIHDGANVVHSFFQRWHAGDAIGKTLPPLVEGHHAPQSGQTLQECSVSGQFMDEFDVGNRARNDHDVERTVPDRLIGDVDIAAARVARLRNSGLVHGSLYELNYCP